MRPIADRGAARSRLAAAGSRRNTQVYVIHRRRPLVLKQGQRQDTAKVNPVHRSALYSCSANRVKRYCTPSRMKSLCFPRPRRCGSAGAGPWKWERPALGCCPADPVNLGAGSRDFARHLDPYPRQCLVLKVLRGESRIKPLVRDPLTDGRAGRAEG